jgi:CelD/BcsL family acetyltransferase involved in cellulose biosynthesis
VDEAASLEDVRDDWSRVAAEASSVFSTWEWADTWWAHLGRGRPLRVWRCRAEDGIAAVVPLYEWSSRPLRVARLLGHGPADELAPVCAPGLRHEVADAILRALGASGIDLLLAEQLPVTAGWGRLLDGRLVRREASPVLRWSDGWDAYVVSSSANLREQLRRREQRLHREHRVRVRLTEDPGTLSGDLDTLFRLHRLVRPRSDFGPEPFHRAFAATALERGWLRLWLLEVDDRPAAVWYGFRFGGAEHYYQAGRDPSFDRLSVGFVLLAHTIRAAFDDGICEYRFGRGDEPYKYRLATDQGTLETVALSRGAAGSLLAGALPAARVARALARRVGALPTRRRRASILSRPRADAPGSGQR